MSADYTPTEQALMLAVDVALRSREEQASRVQERLKTADAREAVLLHAVYHVLQYGKLGKQSRARLETAVRASQDGRTHG